MGGGGGGGGGGAVLKKTFVVAREAPLREHSVPAYPACVVMRLFFLLFLCVVFCHLMLDKF